ncbi:MAG: dienelactone hydrolase family protein [Gemmatimonadetes bacterium]|nr:dienelactone hydrolase family protein [Gemmatimonadota bacterium]
MLTVRRFAFALPLALLVAAACSIKPAPMDDNHAGLDADGTALPASGHVSLPAQDPVIPAGHLQAKERLDKSPRHGEWARIAWEPGGKDSLMAWIVYPERKRNAPVVVVIHEIFGLSTWVRGVADQLAADGYIAVAPDLLSLKRGGPSSDELASDSATKLIRGVTRDEMNKGVTAAARYGMSLPAAVKKYGVVGYCWGGSASFNHAVFNAPGLAAAVVYYGTSPEADSLSRVSVPVLGLYGGNDQRVNATIPRADSTMKALGKTYEKEIFDGAGHGFLRAQEGPQSANGANLAAAQKAWPRTIGWFRKYLGG